MGSLADDLHCFCCGQRFSPTRARLRCDCGSPLEQRYRLDDWTPRCGGGSSSSGIWRFETLLPAVPPGRRLSLGEGGTPLVELPSLERRFGTEVWLKDEGRNPTGSFKARGASVAVSELRHLGWRRLVIETIGNAGSAWAAYAARAGVALDVALPRNPLPPELGRVEPTIYGATVQLVDQSPSAQDMPEDRAFVGAFAEPYRVEGEKTILFELFEQLDGLPDLVVWPTGSGVGLVALAKAREELEATGRVAPGAPLTLVAAQHAGGASISVALRDGATQAPAGKAVGVAPGVWPGGESSARYVLRRLAGSVGTYGATADDVQIRETVQALAIDEGLLLSPEGALAVAVLPSLRDDGILPTGGRVVCVNTASPHRYPHLLGLGSARTATGLEPLRHTG